MVQVCISFIDLRHFSTQLMISFSQFNCVCYFRNDVELFESPNVAMSYENEVATLTIQTTKIESSGVYRCVAVNDAGDDEVEALVTVKG